MDTTQALQNIRERIKKERDALEYFKSSYRLATPEDYSAWVRAFLLEYPNTRIKIVDRSFDSYTTWIVLTRTCVLPERYGEEQYNVIVPKDVRFKLARNTIGHGCVYMISPPWFVGTVESIEIYKDTNV